ncbi:MAG: MgtC/SapB family protein, partial [Haloarculaceae archaeon]
MVEIVDSLLLRLLVAFGIGALIGLEREQAESGGTFAGSRTFPLFALVGAIVQAFFPELLPVTVLAIAIPLTVAYAGKILIEGDIGLTTLTAAVLTVILGALTVSSERGTLFAIVLGGIVTVLLSAKPTIHSFVDRIDERERRASLKFILVVLVVLPVLPDRELDILYGLNPRFIWLMVG